MKRIIIVACFVLSACGYEGPEPQDGEATQGAEVTATVPYAHTSGMDNEAYTEPEGLRVIPPPGRRN